MTTDKYTPELLDDEARTFFDRSIGLLCLAGFDGYFKRLNPAWSALLGFSEAELKAKPFIEFVHPDDREATQEIATSLFAGKEIVNFENRYQCKNGSYKWFHWTASLSLENELTYAIAQDITKQKQLEQELQTVNATLTQRVAEQTTALQENQLRIREAQKLAQIGYWEWEIATGTVIWSNEVYQIFGVDPDTFEVSFENYLALLPPDDQALVQKNIEQALQTKNIYEAEHRVIHKDSTVKYLYARGVFVFDDEQNPIKMIGFVQDITRQIEDKLQKEQMQQALIDMQKRMIEELSVPIIPLMDQIIIMPLIGKLDAKRSQSLMRTMLRGISEHRAKIVILDITGVPLIDTKIASYLDKTIQAARLKGTRTIITGMSDAVAETIVDLGIDWSNLETLRDLQTGLLVALNSLGTRLTTS